MSFPPLGKKSRHFFTWPFSGKAAQPSKFAGNLGAEVTGWSQHHIEAVLTLRFIKKWNVPTAGCDIQGRLESFLFSAGNISLAKSYEANSNCFSPAPSAPNWRDTGREQVEPPKRKLTCSITSGFCKDNSGARTAQEFPQSPHSSNLPARRQRLPAIPAA